MTPDEARTALAAARQAYQLNQWEDLRTVLQPAVDGNVLTGDDGAEAVYLMGEYCRVTNALDAAVSYYDFGKQLGSSKWGKKFDDRLAEFTRFDAAVDAQAEGVTQGEATAVLASADDLLGHVNFADALPMYQSVYQGVVDGEPKLRAALGIARCKAYANEFDDATDYANYVKVDGSAKLQEQATELLAWIAQQQTATTDSADGVATDEFRQMMRAAVAAFNQGDYVEGARLSELGMQSEDVPGVDRGRMAWNAALCHLAMDDSATAAPFLDYALTHAAGEALKHAQKVQQMLHDIEAAKSAAIGAGPVAEGQ